MDDRRELLPCPFCGEAWVKVRVEVERGHYAECQHCEASGPGANADDNSVSAIAAWNTRALTPKGGDALREALEALRRDSDRASPGPWSYEEDQEGSSMGWIGHEVQAGRGQVFSSLFKVEGDSGQQAVNAEFTVACVNFVRAALSATSVQPEVSEAAVEAVARALVAELARQDGEDEPWKLDDNMELSYIDQECVNFGDLARAAIAALPPQGEADLQTVADIIQRRIGPAISREDAVSVARECLRAS